MPAHGQLCSDAIHGSLMIKGRKVLDESGTKLFLGKYQVVSTRVTGNVIPGTATVTPPYNGDPLVPGPTATAVFDTLPDGTAAGASAAANTIIAVLQHHGLIA